jgi:type I restriction enzyme S subunit
MEAKVLHKKTRAEETRSKILAPKLRFKGFKDDWKPELLGNTCRVTTGGKDTQNRIDGGAYPFFVRSNTVERINSFSFDGEAILTSGDGVGVGKNFHYINGKFDFHQRVYALLEFKENYSGKFIYQLFVEKFHKRVMRLSAKNSVDSVRMNMITEMSIGFPTLPEQQKIASFLSAVDEKIQQLTRKKELLEQYKKGLMQQLFSGKLRFKPDPSKASGDENGKMFPKWEEKKLGDVCSFFSGGTPASTNKEFYSGSIPFIGSGNIYDSEVDSFITEEALNSSSAKMVEQGDLLYAFYGANSGEVAISKIKGAINQAILCIRSEENIEYLYYVLLINKDKIVAKYLQGGQGNLSANIIKRLKYKLPSVEEQKKIANYLSSIDNKIESVTKQITQTQTFKKGLLQQMFV